MVAALRQQGRRVISDWHQWIWFGVLAAASTGCATRDWLLKAMIPVGPFWGGWVTALK